MQSPAKVGGRPAPQRNAQPPAPDFGHPDEDPRSEQAGDEPDECPRGSPGHQHIVEDVLNQPRGEQLGADATQHDEGEQGGGNAIRADITGQAPQRPPPRWSGGVGFRERRGWPDHSRGCAAVSSGSSCRWTSSWNVPPSAISSSYVPDSSTRPSSSTIKRSAVLSVDKRCAITKLVRPRATRWTP